MSHVDELQVPMKAVDGAARRPAQSGQRPSPVVGSAGSKPLPSILRGSEDGKRRVSSEELARREREDREAKERTGPPRTRLLHAFLGHEKKGAFRVSSRFGKT